MKKEKPQLEWVCRDCGIEANRLTCLKKYGREPLKKAFSVSTYHEGICEACGEKKEVTQSRDFFYPDFSLLKKIKKGARMTIMKKLHAIEDKKCIYDIHYCRAGVGFLFYEPPQEGEVDMTKSEWKKYLKVDKYYPSFKEAVGAEYKRLK
jgi:trehalose-6-phosphate synthase